METIIVAYFALVHADLKKSVKKKKKNSLNPGCVQAIFTFVSQHHVQLYMRYQITGGEWRRVTWLDLIDNSAYNT